MCILITGSSGLIGTNLINFFKEKKINFIDLDLKNSTIKHDITKNFSSNKKLETLKPKTIIHFAAISRIKTCLNNTDKTFEVNIKGTKNVLEYAFKKKAKVIFASSYTCHGDYFLNPYTFSKYLGEELCSYYNQYYGLKINILRLFNIYGIAANLVRIFENNKKNNLPFEIYGDGKNKKHFIHINDVCEGIFKLMKKDFNFETFNFGESKKYSIKKISSLFKAKKIIYLSKSKHDVNVTNINMEETYEKLNWKPKINLENYIKLFVENLNFKNESN